jgi:flagellar biosynthesis chaperone FliJ
MAVSRGLRRLLRIRDLEEEQSRQALESAQGELNRLEHALVVTTERERQGRRLVQASAHTGQLSDRLAGLEEARSVDRLVAVLEPRIGAKQLEVMNLRQAFLLKRVERRQAETLIEETEAKEAIEADRRSQQSLDDWFSSKLFRRANGPEAAAKTDLSASDELAPQTVEVSAVLSQDVSTAEDET